MGTEHDEATDMRIEKLEHSVSEILKILNGESGGTMGLVTRMQIVWHSYVWLVGIVGAGLGSIVTIIVKNLSS